MLEEFLNDPNFPQQTVNIYNLSSTMDNGVITKGYKLQETRDVWIFNKSIVKQIYSDKTADELDGYLYTDEALDSTDIINYGSNWYECKLPNDILFAGEVVQIGLKLIKEPDVLDEVAEDEYVLGDSWGLL